MDSWECIIDDMRAAALLADYEQAHSWADDILVRALLYSSQFDVTGKQATELAELYGKVRKHYA